MRCKQQETRKRRQGQIKDDTGDEKEETGADEG